MLKDFLESNDFAVSVLGKQNKWKLQQRWREIFTSDVKEQTGKWMYEGCDWHAFSYGFSPCINGAEAERLFDSTLAGEIFCISSNEEVPAYQCIGGKLPSYESISAFLCNAPGYYDLFIISCDFKWTMVFVHEQSFGPYYCLSTAEPELK